MDDDDDDDNDDDNDDDDVAPNDDALVEVLLVDGRKRGCVAIAMKTPQTRAPKKLLS